MGRVYNRRYNFALNRPGGRPNHRYGSELDCETLGPAEYMRRAEESPETRLWLEVVYRAVIDVRQLRAKSVNPHISPARRANAKGHLGRALWWANANDIRAIGSLRWIAELIADDPDGFVEKIRRLI